MSSSSSYWWLDEHSDESLLRIAVFQGESLTDGDVSSSVAQVELQAKRASEEQSANLLVFPELFLSGYGLDRNTTLAAARYIVEKKVISHLQRVAHQYSIALLICYPELVGEQMYNSATLIDEQGVLLLTYRKTHLWAEKERHLFAEGEELSPVVTLRNVRVAVMICYDLEMGEVARCLTLLGAQLLLVPTALAISPANESIVGFILPTRALENHVWIAYANLALPKFVGLSCIVGPDGHRLCQVDNDPLVVADLFPKHYLSSIQSTPYLADRRPSLYPAITDPRYAVKLPDHYRYMDE